MLAWSAIIQRDSVALFHALQTLRLEMIAKGKKESTRMLYYYQPSL